MSQFLYVNFDYCAEEFGYPLEGASSRQNCLGAADGWLIGEIRDIDISTDLGRAPDAEQLTSATSTASH